jgi:hypothetical protein
MDPIEVVVGRIDGRTELMLKHLETLNSRVGKVEVRLDVVERVEDRRQGAADERKRWIGFAAAAKGFLPAGGGLAGVAALLHYVWAQGQK